ncbi:Propanediol diffusion facilitator [Streptomyces sp. S4.7]|uniref:MIP/aquaporin family protein n=1 Tax=Streptomyces sp. S4.7 TaxID=2705439 RepID=UPI001398F14A|nr:MIP/aquaporin family protein [Streptomyces sp. S4.7]QHY97728.1 Propanediol diffusion facilitator [Streptomyces sp. S4.7]
MAVEIPPLIKPSSFRRRATLGGECLAEFLGTFVLIAFGCGVVAMVVAALPGSGRTAGPTTFFISSGDWLLITWGWAMAVVFGVYVAGGVSGAHINPAVTLAFAVRRKFAWAKVLPYMGSQLAGAFVGAALVYWVYGDAINAFDAAMKGPKTDGHTLASFSIFGTFPAPYFNGGIWGPLLDQIVGTAFLVMFIVAVVDLRNTAVKANLGPLIIGFAVAAIGMSYGANAGYAINPARDLGPRLLTWAAGWGDLAMPGSLAGAFSAYWWIPIVGPLIGGVIGVLLYDLFIGDVLHIRAQLAKPQEVGDTRPVKGTDEP